MYCHADSSFGAQLMLQQFPIACKIVCPYYGSIFLVFRGFSSGEERSSLRVVGLISEA